MKKFKIKALSLAAAAVIAMSSASPAYAWMPTPDLVTQAELGNLFFNGFSIEKIISGVINNASLKLEKYKLLLEGKKPEEPAVTNPAKPAESEALPYSLPESVKSGYLFKPADAGKYTGNHYKKLNGNVPVFADSDLAKEAYEKYGRRDSLNRCTAAIALLGKELMPTEPRGSISGIKPTGWHTVRYDDLIQDKYLYNRSHLLAYSLTGENANEDNLITGTRYMNQEGMEPFESRIANYINRTGNHVLYRVTPIFEGNNLLASGVHMEAVSLEDGGDGIMFNVYVYNVQPGIVIDYKDGSSYAEPEEKIEEEIKKPEPAEDVNNNASQNSGIVKPGNTSGGDYSEYTYVLNTNTFKFHYPNCASVARMSEKNKLGSDLTRDELMRLGYSPCGNCKP